MTMQLDARHRAMLLEMGVRVWAQPKARPHTAEPAHQTAPVQATARTQALPQAPAMRPLQPAPASPETPASKPERRAAPTGHWHVQAPHLLYPTADPAQTPSALGAGWLLVAEAFADGDPLAEGAERLLANMLHALQLHRHPRVALCSVAPASSVAGGAPDAASALAHHVETFAPSVVLVMGRSAVRAALARSEPLGKLRGAALSIAGVPAVVTFGAYFLLRSPESKPAAWADLCRARALVGHGVAAAPMP